jgi:GNAT superfamily N-acetyltransferase
VIRLREAIPGDEAALLALLRGLAEYERLLPRFRATEAGLAAALFGPRPVAQAVLAEEAGEALAMALWHRTFSSFGCRTGFFLEDIFVRPEARGRGIGRMLFRDLAHRLAAEGGESVTWAVLGWNRPALDFYRGLGAEAEDDEWTRMRLRGPALERLTG